MFIFYFANSGIGLGLHILNQKLKCAFWREVCPICRKYKLFLTFKCACLFLLK